MVARRRRAGRVADARVRVRVRHAHLALETVRVTKEHAQDRTEIGHETVARAAGHEPVTDRDVADQVVEEQFVAALLDALRPADRR